MAETPNAEAAATGRPEALDRVQWLRYAPFIGLHAACLGVIAVGASPWILLAALAGYVARMFFITGFYHRYFCHRAFRTSRPFQAVMAFLGGAAMQRGALWWASQHRHHHRFAEREEDPHSPHRRGLLWSHALWFMTARHEPTRWGYVRDWARYPELVWLNRYEWLPGAAWLAASAGLGWLLPRATALEGLVWVGCVSTVAVYHGTYTINSLAHRFGRRRFDTSDESRNNFWLALITLGEGWHNNHHRYPASARQGFRRGEIDIAYAGLCLLRAARLIHGLRPVPPALAAPPEAGGEEEAA